MLRRLVWTASGLSLAVVVLLSGGPPSARAACAPELLYRTSLYYSPGRLRHRLERGARAGTATVPPCRDTGVVQAAASVAVFRIGGLSAELAVMDARGDVYLARGFLPQLPSHPLHAAVFGPRRGVPDETAGARCSPLRSLAGTVLGAGTLFGTELRVSSADSRLRLQRGEEAQVTVDALTVVRGPRRLHLPYVGRGRRLVARVRRCRPNDDPGAPASFVARLMAPAPR